ncbi:MAG: metallophosphoesterase, partial [Salinibacterium sp.]|nr:metallophosphoesterase [Salinibacterium sp.]
MSSPGGTRIAGAALATLGTAALGAFAWGALVERNRFTVRRETIPVLDPAARPITVLHLSDLHMAPWQTAKQDWVASLADYEPDLVVVTGDSLGHPRGLEGLERALAPFRGVAGVFVHGSNDYFSPTPKNPFSYFRDARSETLNPPRLDTAKLEEFFESLGWLDLNNTARAIEVRGTRIELFGTSDAHRGWDRLDKLSGAIETVRENVEWSAGSGDGILSIGVTHAPYRRVLDDFVNQGAQLML